VETPAGFFYSSNIEAALKVFLSQSYAKKALSCAVLLSCNLMLCGSLRIFLAVLCGLIFDFKYSLIWF